MTLKEIINNNGLKMSHIQKELKVSKAGLHLFLNDRMSVERSIQLRTILAKTARSILNDLEKSA